MDNPGEILRLCRLCLVKDQVNIPIFEEQGDIRQIFLKISSCLPVKVSRDDKLPKKICDGCSNKLDLLYEFWSSTANAEKTLLSWLGQAGVKDVDETISAVAQQIAKPTEPLVKEETETIEDIHLASQVEEGSQSFEESSKNEAEAPPAKRARRTAAVKAQINITPESDDEDDMDAVEPLTKMEDESDESEGEEKDPSFTEVAGTSADDQAGPSGVGKEGVEAPLIDCETYIIEEIVTTSDYLSEKKVYSCTYCYKSFGSNSRLQRHMVSFHTHEYRVFCELCGKGFYNQWQVNKHFRAVHLNLGPKYTKPNEKKFACTYCDKKYKENIFLLQHIAAVHTHEYNYFCEICGKGFFMLSRKTAHMRYVNHVKTPTERDTHDRKWICEYCSKVFTSRYAFARHLKAHQKSSLPQFECDICKKTLSSKAMLIEHRRSHTGERPSQCEVCGKSFSCTRALNVHRNRTHGRVVQKYECKECEKKFQFFGKLKKHYAHYHEDAAVPDEETAKIKHDQLILYSS